jgi:hypothetical protein
MLFDETGEGGGSGYAYLRTTDARPPVRLAESFNIDPVWSPDGRFIAHSELSGRSLPGQRRDGR